MASEIEISTNAEEHFVRLLDRPGAKYFNLNPFEVLQLELNIEPTQIKKKYRKLSLVCHPDKNGNTERAMMAFQIINNAYKMLQDKDTWEYATKVGKQARERVQEAMIKADNKTPDPQKFEEKVRKEASKIFTELEQRRTNLEQVDVRERKKKREEEAVWVKKMREREKYQEKWEEQRDDRIESWRSWKTKSGTLKKPKKSKIPKPPSSPPIPPPPPDDELPGVMRTPSIDPKKVKHRQKPNQSTKKIEPTQEKQAIKKQSQEKQAIKKQSAQEKQSTKKHSTHEKQDIKKQSAQEKQPTTVTNITEEKQQTATKLTEEKLTNATKLTEEKQPTNATKLPEEKQPTEETITTKPTDQIPTQEKQPANEKQQTGEQKPIDNLTEDQKTNGIPEQNKETTTPAVNEIDKENNQAKPKFQKVGDKVIFESSSESEESSKGKKKKKTQASFSFTN